MTALTRRRADAERPDHWKIFRGDVVVGSIGPVSGVPLDRPQWFWTCGISTDPARKTSTAGNAESFDEARAAFAKAWTIIEPRLTEEDYAAQRRQRAFTAWKYAMWDRGCRMPTQMTSGSSTCFCGAELTLSGANDHIRAAHMDMA